jgi:SAM-dependent methyltransferase
MPEKDRHSPEYWNNRYAGQDYGFGTEPNAYLRSQGHRLRPEMSAFVPGDGEGRNGVWLAQRGLDVHTLDLSDVAIAKARRLAEQRGVRIDARQGDLREWEGPEARFDVVASLFVHFDEPPRREIHRKLLAALRPGGLLIVEGFHPDRFGPSDPGLPERHFTVQRLREDFAAAEELELEEVTTALSEGRMHVGEARVVHGVWRKR